MKKFLVILLVLAMLLSLAACKKAAPEAPAASPVEEAPAAQAPAEAAPAPAAQPAEEVPAETEEEPIPYALGDKMEDFTVTLDDGSEVSLYGLLKEKKAVLINFWASWCSPCKREFPFMQEAYEEMKDEIAVIALSTEPGDTMETVAKVREELGLSTLPMGLDIGLYDHFLSTFGGAIPGSVIVDRNGAVCFMETGSIPSKDHFIRLFSAFTGDDYNESVILHNIPAQLPTATQPDEAAMKAALGIKDKAISVLPVEGESTWPFMPEGKAGVKPSNIGVMDTKASLTLQVEAGAGAALQFDCLANYLLHVDGLFSVLVDDVPVKTMGNSKDWKPGYVPLGDESAAHKVTFEYNINYNSNASDELGLKNLRVIGKDKLDKLEKADAKPIKKLPGSECKLELIEGEVKPVSTITNGEEEGLFGILQGDKLKARIRIGEDINEQLAFLADQSSCYLLEDLPYDEEGYLFEYTADESEEPSILTMALYADSGEDEAVEEINFLQNEAAYDAFIARLTPMIQAAYPDEKIVIEWKYTDGTPKKATTTAADAPKLPAGMSSYVVCVIDEDGKPVENVMLQLCDLETCQVSFTGASGAIEKILPAREYEIHVLKAPEGYHADSMVYILGEEGGQLTITLTKK